MWLPLVQEKNPENYEIFMLRSAKKVEATTEKISPIVLITVT